jgi:hypothetical protein
MFSSMFLLHYVRIRDQTNEQVSHYIHVFTLVLVLLPRAPIVLFGAANTETAQITPIVLA